ncbi:phosphopantetheine-binding protein [Streptomyces stramineus]|uniref:Carrier domain-containing protein n=1 Tax=Streptomyces stramineus TaxID=173861 RepID=A0ABP3L8G3_9ACTN
MSPLGRKARRRSRLRALERDIAAVWAEVLGRQAVGPEEDFLALGGNSVDAMKIVSRVEELAGTELSIRVLLEGRTVAGMAERVESARAGERAR